MTILAHLLICGCIDGGLDVISGRYRKAREQHTAYAGARCIDASLHIATRCDVLRGQGSRKVRIGTFLGRGRTFSPMVSPFLAGMAAGIGMMLVSLGFAWWLVNS